MPDPTILILIWEAGWGNKNPFAWGGLVTLDENIRDIAYTKENRELHPSKDMACNLVIDNTANTKGIEIWCETEYNVRNVRCLSITIQAESQIKLHGLPGSVLRYLQGRKVIIEMALTAIRVLQIAQQTIPINTFTKINFDTIEDDRLGDFDLVTDTFTVVKAGWYSLAGAICLWDMADGSKLIVSLFKNGTRFAEGRTIIGGIGYCGQNATTIAKLAVGDVISLQVYHSSAGVIKTSGAPGFLSIYQLDES